ncbi:hypothetical protein RI367_005058 [Sorochytrium milnesiophthora]
MSSRATAWSLLLIVLSLMHVSAVWAVSASDYHVDFSATPALGQTVQTNSLFHVSIAVQFPDSDCKPRVHFGDMTFTSRPDIYNIVFSLVSQQPDVHATRFLHHAEVEASKNYVLSQDFYLPSSTAGAQYALRLEMTDADYLSWMQLGRHQTFTSDQTFGVVALDASQTPQASDKLFQPLSPGISFAPENVSVLNITGTTDLWQEYTDGKGLFVSSRIMVPAATSPEANRSSESMLRAKTPAQALLPGIAKMHHVAGQALCCAISGVFTGWNPGLAFGWPSLMIAYLLATVLFWMLGLCIAEMSCTLPFSGGPATFAQAAYGQAGYVAVILNFPADAGNAMPILWLVLLGVVVLTNYWPRVYFRSALVISVVCVAIMAVYVFCSLAHVGSIQKSLFVSTTPTTMSSIVQALPFGIFFYWGVETLPLTAEECHDITKSAPRAGIISLSVLTLFSALMMWLNCGLMPTLDSLISSNQALLDSFFYQIGVPLTAPTAIYISNVILAIPVAGWLQGSLYAAARHTYSLARAGYLPIKLSYTHKGSPVNATLACAAVAYAFAIIFFVVLANSGVNINTILLSVTTWLLCASYASELIVFVRLRQKMRYLPRPWISPVGIPGALAGTFIAFLAIFGPLATDPVTTASIFGGYAVFLVLIMAYYHFFAKKRLLNSPEKTFINAQLQRLFHKKVKEATQTDLISLASMKTPPKPSEKVSTIRALKN